MLAKPDTTPFIDGAKCPWPRNERIRPGTPGLRWHVVHSHSLSEPAALRMLQIGGFETYYPMFRILKTPPLRKLSRDQRRRVHLFRRAVLRPLFPRYIFVRFDVKEDRWHDIFHMAAIHGLACEGNLPFPLPDHVVPDLKALEEGGAIPLKTPTKQLLIAVGDKCRVNEGPFTGLAGFVDELAESERLWLLLDVFGRKTRVQFDLDQVFKV